MNARYFLLFMVLLCSPCIDAATSVCYGTTSNGRLENGVRLPSQGNNFVSYSTLAGLLGRTYVHSEVYKIVVTAYKNLQGEAPEKVYKYAETGFKNGGEFKPHKTHRNGLSVDFMTPVLNDKGESVHLPTHSLNKYGYNIEFDEQGVYRNLTIDFEAMAAHIVSLHHAAKNLGYGVWRVIFDPKLQPALFDTPYGEYLKQNITFSKKPSWVRHDEHYHVDFLIPCGK